MRGFLAMLFIVHRRIDRYVTRRGGSFTADSAFCFNLLLTEAEITAACGYAYGAALTAQRFFKIV